MSGTQALDYFRSTRGKAMQWVAVLAGPLAWFVHLSASYLAVLYVCKAEGSGLEWLLHLLTVLAAAVAAAGALIGWLHWRRAHGPDDGMQAEALQRARFMAWAAIGFGLFFLAVVLLSEAANLVYGICL